MEAKPIKSSSDPILTRSQFFVNRRSSSSSSCSSRDSCLTNTSQDSSQQSPTKSPLSNSAIFPLIACTTNNKTYYPNGNLQYEGETLHNERHGNGKLYYSNSVLQYEGTFYQNHISSEKAVIYHTNKNVKYKGCYKKGKRHGYGELYHFNGVLRFKGHFENNYISDNNSVLYYTNGNVEFEGKITRGKKDANGIYYHFDGNMKKSGVFREGKIINVLKESQESKRRSTKGTKQSNSDGKLKMNSSTIFQKKTSMQKKDFGLIQFNIDIDYINKVVNNKVSEYVIKITSKDCVQNFISKHKKNELVRIIDEETGKLRFEGVVFVRKKYSFCSNFNTFGNIQNRALYQNDKKQRSGIQFCKNGKIKHRVQWNKDQQMEDGFCIAYHHNGTIGSVGRKVLGHFSDIFADFYKTGVAKCIRMKTDKLGVCEDKRYGKEGVLFYPDGSIRYKGFSDFWGYNFVDSE